MDNIAEVNIKRYVSPPTWDLIHNFIQELGMSNHRFENFFGIPYNIIAQVKLGTKRLPPQYWHFVYERIVPEIGPGYVKYCQNNSIPKRIPKTITKTITEQPQHHVALQSANVASLPDNQTSVADEHDRTNNLK